MLNKIRNLIKRCLVTNPGKDNGQFPISQVSYLGKTGNSEEIYPYGMGAVAPKDSLGILLNVNGDEGNRAHIATNTNLRKKGLKPGEAYFGNMVTGSVTVFSENGDWNVTIKKDGNLTFNGNLNITVNGDANLTANEANINASTANINANTNLGGGGPAIARTGDLVMDVDAPLVPIGIIGVGSSNHTAS